MLDETSRTTQAVISILFFPYFFQGEVVRFVWGAHDPLTWMALKRVFLLAPAIAVLIALWISIACILTIIIRNKRRKFSTALMLCWWDLARAILHFWGGLFRALFVLATSLFGASKLGIAGLWGVLRDIVLAPMRITRRATQRMLKPGLPWIATLMTMVWSLIEATIFTYVMTPLVLDTLSNMTGENLSESLVRIPLFLFMSFVVLGSYAVLSALAEAVRTRDVSMIVKILLVEAVAMIVEVVFLYREFVDALIPWFTQHVSGQFEPGLWSILGTAFLIWLGIRALSWYLFAAHGTPTLLAIIQGTGLLATPDSGHQDEKAVLTYTGELIRQLKAEKEWFKKTGEEILNAFLLPPLQIFAALVNFCTLMLVGHTVFDLPFKDIGDIADTKTILKNIRT